MRASLPCPGEQVVDQGGHVADIHLAIVVHVAAQAGILISEVARVAGAAVDVGVGLVHMAGIVQFVNIFEEAVTDAVFQPLPT